MRRQLRLVFTILTLSLAMVLVACSTATGSPTISGTPGSAPNGLQLPPGFSTTIYASGLHQPTAMAYGPDNKLYVTQLNGGEDDRKGQVVVLDGPNATPRVLLDGLDKLTGIAWRKDELWLVAKRNILETKGTSTALAPPTTVVKDLPFNGRSNGQIDLLPDDRLLFESSGNGSPDSAMLLTLKPGETTPRIYAKGFKGAYAHASDINSGAVWSTEINDDLLAGAVPPEELNQISEGKDYGWPHCFAAQQPAPEHGGSKASCKATELPIALFEPHATPTGLEWGGNTKWPAPYNHALFVALWNGQPPRLALVQLGDELSMKPTTFIGGMKRPMDVRAAREGGLLVMDQEVGVIYLVRKL